MDKTAGEEPETLKTGECSYDPVWGCVQLLISPDSMVVTVVEVAGEPAHCSRLTPDELQAFLIENKITHGLIPEALVELAAGLRLESTWQGSLIVAEGRPPTVPGGAEYNVFAGAEVVVGDGNSITVDGEPYDSGAIKEYFASKRKPADTSDIFGKVVRAGDVLVTKKSPVAGVAGYDIFGRAISPPEFMDVVAGDHVQLASDGQKFLASLFGYVLILERNLSVVSPIVVADDSMTAWYVQLPQMAPRKAPFGQDLTALLLAAGLKRETEGGCVEELSALLDREEKEGWYVAARGKEPVRGSDGVLLFEGTDPPSALRDDGSIDYRVLNLVKTIEAESHFATLSMPTSGEAGFTLLDEELPAEPGTPLKVDAKANVRIEERDDGEVWYYSETEGVIQYQNGQLEIDPLYQVKGNVDFSTGNIDVDCCLLVAGNVCSDFTVKSTKDIVINGILEPGSKLVVQGNLQVKGGIIGDKTEVVVMGNLQAEFVQDAKIVVKGQILINQYTFSAVIRSVGSIKVGPGKGERGGSIVGGTVCSSSGIEASSTGSPSNVLTTVVVEPAPHKLALLKQLKKGIIDCEANITKIMRTLNLQAIEPGLVKELLADATPKQRELYVDILHKLSTLVKQQQGLLADKNKLRDKLWGDVDRMSVLVTKAFYANTKVRIAKKELVNRTDRGRTSIRHDRTRLIIDAAKGVDDVLPD